ncbi:hypothetical protein GF357_01920 [Candidatus Dojkabacteria bacterium]|nr:hypothetical protein [Candidatus Dojkabacteria bacterium]
MKRNIVFFLSTGRVGTQWFVNTFRNYYKDLVNAEHEPLAHRYRPVDFYRNYKKTDQMLDDEEIKTHLGSINDVIKKGKLHYIETGWPAYAFIPLLCKIYPERLKVIHIVRNPVEVALSLSTHNIRDSNHPYSKAAMLNPKHSRAKIRGKYKARWNHLTQYEQNLYQWTEINSYGVELERIFPMVKFLLVKKEDILGSNSSKEFINLMNFLELPVRSKPLSLLAKPYDKYSKQSNQITDVRLIYSYKQTIKLAKKFGYDSDTLIHKDYITERYISKNE